MTDHILPRRRFLIGLASLVAAPAIVRVSSLMPVKALPREILTWRGIPIKLVDIIGDSYGRSPMMDALPDALAMQLETMKRDPVVFVELGMPNLFVLDWQKRAMRTVAARG